MNTQSIENDKIEVDQTDPLLKSGIFAACGSTSAMSLVADGLFMLRERGKDMSGIAAVLPDGSFAKIRRAGFTSLNFNSMFYLVGIEAKHAIGCTQDAKTLGEAEDGIKDISLSDLSLLGGQMSMGSLSIAFDGHISNFDQIKNELIERGSVFQSDSEAEIVLHLMARSLQRNIPDRLADALRKIEGEFALLILTKKNLVGARSPDGGRHLFYAENPTGIAFSSMPQPLERLNFSSAASVKAGELIVVDVSLKVPKVSKQEVYRQADGNNDENELLFASLDSTVPSNRSDEERENALSHNGFVEGSGVLFQRLREFDILQEQDASAEILHRVEGLDSKIVSIRNLQKNLKSFN
ncbi:MULTISPECIES: hypothetical protein [unclassified Marinovum]